MLYQDRLSALINVFALHSLVLVLAVGWQAHIQDAHHLYVTAGIALVFKAIIIPTALHRIVRRLGIHRTLEVVGGVGPVSYTHLDVYKRQPPTRLISIPAPVAVTKLGSVTSLIYRY